MNSIYAKYLFTNFSTRHDCWWLVRDFYKTVLNIDLPQYPWIHSMKKRCKMIEQAIAQDQWKEIAVPCQYCIALMAPDGKHWNHAGIFIKGAEPWKARPEPDSILHLQIGQSGRMDNINKFKHIKFYTYTHEG